jgi:hypothetical protein
MSSSHPLYPFSLRLAQAVLFKVSNLSRVKLDQSKSAKSSKTSCSAPSFEFSSRAISRQTERWLRVLLVNGTSPHKLQDPRLASLLKLAANIFKIARIPFSSSAGIPPRIAAHTFFEIALGGLAEVSFLHFPAVTLLVALFYTLHVSHSLTAASIFLTNF